MFVSLLLAMQFLITPSVPSSESFKEALDSLTVILRAYPDDLQMDGFWIRTSAAHKTVAATQDNIYKRG